MVGADISGFTVCAWKYHVESVSWVTEDFQWEHKWIAETNVTLEENVILEARSCDIDVPCPLQWGLLWFSAPTNLNLKFVNNGTTAAKFRETVNCAIQLTCNIAFDGTHTPRAVFLTGGDNFLVPRA